MSRLILIRHAHAGSREKWTGPDDQRPLSDKGWSQARGLVDVLHDEPSQRIVSSPSLRCTQTLMPLAEARGLPVEEDPRLLEGHDPEDTFAWLEREVAARSIAVCTHGDIVPAVLDLAAERGATLPSEQRWAKGSTWILDFESGRWL
ncbi:MAG: histidine phosphatase family protein, partial [Candidatus Dormibacteraeota bacterium]|nr:histidine phosphatase family protein [Candidatus Dormibacteraeota bacterium]